ncbi:MAG: TVP38/TMEM64 family protein [Candidatus Heimdallarchaeota archaeon]|nr:TVP38/TMEM64 family protein [Candidatus Heimdallarchaeota archaeon]
MISFDLLFILGGLIIQVFLPGFPKETLLFQSGASYGVLYGSIINWLGMVLGAQVAYEVVRRSVETGGKFSTLLVKYKDSKPVKYVEERGIKGLFVIRLIPNAPNDVLSLVAGALFLPRKGFFLVSIVTAIPYAILFAYLGHIGKDFISTTDLLFINSIFLLISISILTIRYYTHNTEDKMSEKDSELPHLQ